MDKEQIEQATKEQLRAWIAEAKGYVWRWTWQWNAWDGGNEWPILVEPEMADEYATEPGLHDPDWKIDKDNPDLAWVPYWPADISLAWELMEEMDALGMWCRIKSAVKDLREGIDTRGWAVEMGKWWNREGFGVWDESAPVAICKAYLLARLNDKTTAAIPE